MGDDKNRIPAIVAFENDDEERDLAVRELEEAIHRYIKSGVKSRQLDKLVDLEMKFQKGYEKCFSSENLRKIIVAESKREVFEDSQLVTMLFDSEKKDVSREVDTFMDRLLKKIEPLLDRELTRMLDEIAYLSHINMLYELYEKENKLRREEQEYRSMLKKYEHIDEIIEQLKESRRMEIDKLQEVVKVPKKVIYGTISENPKYFNVRKKSDTYQISLSPAGRRISGYVINSTIIYSQETLDRLVYKNCYATMEGLEKVFNNKNGRIVEKNIKFEGISPEKERALQSKYYQVANKVFKNDEKFYRKWEKLEGEDNYNEEIKYKFRLPGCDSSSIHF